MKKWIIGFFILLVVAVVSIYLFIPSSLTISSVRVLNCSPGGSFRTISDEKKWARLFPADTAKFKIRNSLVNTVYVNIHQNDEIINSIIYLLPFNNDSTAIQWQCKISTSNNPFKRIQRYQSAVAVKNDMDKVLDNLRSFVQKSENIYGFKIERTTFTDTLLLAVKSKASAYPTTTEVYQQVNSLRAKIASQNATITGYPMVNITPINSNHYQFMVAIPVDRVLPDNQPFIFRRMIPASFMTAEVKGGPYTIKEALYQMQVYFSENRKTAMAIPFEYHITDRQAEPDTSKWITKIYAPVF
jgi:hypothetical protein